MLCDVKHFVPVKDRHQLAFFWWWQVLSHRSPGCYFLIGISGQLQPMRVLAQYWL